VASGFGPDEPKDSAIDVSKMGYIPSTWLDWLVVLTILKNISQWEGLSHILWKIIND